MALMFTAVEVAGTVRLSASSAREGKPTMGGRSQKPSCATR
jgi:hypothetical protein